ncbi:MAG TPA: alkaline phosphatase family protein [Solirubrobacteraceae bacterium]|nr:alkaline phosphatase family protein [Solirubrobacteraceae bacterium]
MSSPGKLVLCVIDAMAPAMLERAVAEGVAPVLAALMARGSYVNDCVAAFPSVTPVCAASIVTGAAQDEHHIPGMNWFHREEERYVEYGSSFRAGQRFGITRQLTDLVYNMNRAHLSQQTPTVFETLDDAGQRTAGTTYLMYRGRHRHEPQRDSALTRFASRLMRHPVMGPRELFYADIFASRPTGCRSGLGMPGVRDRHSGCVSAYMVEHDLFDFLLLSLPDNDWYSHKHGPEGQLRSIAQADLQLARVFDAGGGIDSFLQEHAVIVMADHSQAPVESAIDLQEELAGLGVLQPEGANLLGALTGTRTQSRTRGADDGVGGPRIAVCPSQRAAMVYALNEAERDAMRASVVARALAIEGVDLVAWLSYDAHDRPSEGVVSSPGRGELRFAPGGDLLDARGASWHVDGALGVLDAAVRGGDNALTTPAYPDALARLWPALTCPTSGEVLLSAAPGYEFVDWGGAAHVGGGSHGSLHVSDSLGALVLCGLEGGATGRRPTSRGGWDRLLQSDPDALPSGGRASNPQWAIRDIAPLVLRHFGLTAEGEQPPVGL